jgi:GDP-L-fucose synthase
MREFLHVDDLGQAVLFALENKLEEHLYNVGSGVDLTIKELALFIQSVVEHEGEIAWDSTKPDGTPRKLMDVSKLELKGWSPSLSLDEGIIKTYYWFLTNLHELREV